MFFLDNDRSFQLGKDMLLNQKYGAAREQFERVCKHPQDYSQAQIEEANYWIAYCALELFNKDGEPLMKVFLMNYPTSPWFSKANLYLGNYYFKRKKYAEATAYFDKISADNLPFSQRAEFHFKSGYAAFETYQRQGNEKLLDQSLLHFTEVKTLLPNNFLPSANYYAAHIYYIRKKYESALKSFLTLVKDESFGPIVPYYITQIYYLQGKYDDAVRYAGPLLKDSTNVNRTPEIARIIGESYYRKGEYAASLPYLKMYEKGSGKLGREDNYQMGYAYFRAENYDAAMHYFQAVAGNDDLLSQNALYHLGDCYIQLKNKTGARSAFALAAKSKFDSAIAENSLFNYAKLSYELGFNPYSEAIRAFDQYIKTYPNSSKRDESLGFLANLYLTSGNYQQALASLSRFQRNTSDFRALSQKVNYNFALVHYNNNKTDSAIHYLEKALQFDEDLQIKALSYYWLGESFYRLGDYATALENYLTFESFMGIQGLPEHKLVNYNIGYAQLQLKAYQAANLAFRKFVETKPAGSNSLLNKLYNDALVRAGDTYFVMRDFQGAIPYYTKAIESHSAEADYALFQNAQALGLLGKYDQEIENLQKMAVNFPKSPFNAEVQFDLGKTYMLLSQPERALQGFMKVVESYPNSRFVNESLASMGLIYFNEKQDDNALQMFDKLIRRDRHSKEAENALSTVKIIYLEDKKDVEGLDHYFKEIQAVLPSGSLDSSAYSIADNAYKEGDLNEASALYQKYLLRFPEGIFATKANFYKAECDYKRGDLAAALLGYEYAAKHDHSLLVEEAAVKVVEIRYKSEDYNGAIRAALLLDSIAEKPLNKTYANLVQVRGLLKLQQFDALAKTAPKVLAIENLTPEQQIEIKFALATAQYNLGELDNAAESYSALSHDAKGEERAESYYRIAEISYKKGDFSLSKTQVVELVKKCTENPDWITKGLLLLADDYMGLKDSFQAKHTLKTIIESSNIPAYVNEAKSRLDKINSIEAAPSNEPHNATE